jgi:hypothetical protein
LTKNFPESKIIGGKLKWKEIIWLRECQQQLPIPADNFLPESANANFSARVPNVCLSPIPLASFFFVNRPRKCLDGGKWATGKKCIPRTFIHTFMMVLHGKKHSRMKQNMHQSPIIGREHNDLEMHF